MPGKQRECPFVLEMHQCYSPDEAQRNPGAFFYEVMACSMKRGLPPLLGFYLHI